MKESFDALKRAECNTLSRKSVLVSICHLGLTNVYIANVYVFNVDFYYDIIIPIIYLLYIYIYIFESIIHVAVQFPHEGLKKVLLKRTTRKTHKINLNVHLKPLKFHYCQQNGDSRKSSNSSPRDNRLHAFNGITFRLLFLFSAEKCNCLNFDLMREEIPPK